MSALVRGECYKFERKLSYSGERRPSYCVFSACVAGHDASLIGERAATRGRCAMKGGDEGMREGRVISSSASLTNRIEQTTDDEQPEMSYFSSKCSTLFRLIIASGLSVVEDRAHWWTWPSRILCCGVPVDCHGELRHAVDLGRAHFIVPKTGHCNRHCLK